MVIGFKKQFKEPIMQGIKVHTLRDDLHDRWISGRTMHMATGVRTKNYNCFKQTECISTQETVIKLKKGRLSIIINAEELNNSVLDLFIKRDGFKNKAEFIYWFFPTGDGIVFKKLLHWTDLRY